eukprot:341969_1
MIELLINGFLTLSCKSLFQYLPMDIINLIILYYTFSDINPLSFIVHLRLPTFDNKLPIIRIFSPSTNIFRDVYLKSVYKSYWYKDNRLYDNQTPYIGTVIHNESLPYQLHSQLIDKNNINQKWSMIVRAGAGINDKKESQHWLQSVYLTAINVNINSMSYDFELPSFPHSMAASILYHNKHLYAINGKHIYSLDFDQHNSNYNKWNIFQSYAWTWNEFGNNLKWDRYGTGCCMIDNKYIANIGGLGDWTYDTGYCYSYGELFALNCKKSIGIKPFIGYRYYPKCIYHKMFHKIAVGVQKLDLYDINKDIWVTIKQRGMRLSVGLMSKNIWISSNPNIVMCSGVFLNGKAFIDKYDLRINALVHSMIPKGLEFSKEARLNNNWLYSNIVTHITL